jgi:hypothetical protein
MDVDPSRGDDSAACVDLAARRSRMSLDADDTAARNRDVALKRRRAGSVNDRSASNDNVVHLGLHELATARRFARERA